MGKLIDAAVIFICGLCAVILFVGAAGLLIDGDLKGAVMLGAALIVEITLVTAAWRRISPERRKVAEAMFLAFQGKTFEQAVAIAKEQRSVPLARALVADRVDVAHHDWRAFEKSSIQFVIARNVDGAAMIRRI